MTENETPKFKLYSLIEITGATYFGGPLVAGILVRQNYINLGKKVAGNWALIVGIISTIFIIIGIFAIPKDIISKIPSPLIPAIYTGIVYLIIKGLQGNEIKEHKKNNGEFYSGWAVVGISLICAIISAAVFFGYAYLSTRTAESEKNNNSILLDVKTVTDKDSNIYNTVLIGPQIWMKENLRTTNYNDGTPIPLITNGNVWSHLTSGAYCWYNNDSANKNTYGALYNWFAVNTNKLCPTGWHIPTEDEWRSLKYSFEDNISGKNRLSLYTEATRKSGFAAVPGGHRSNLFLDDDTAYFPDIYDYRDNRNKDTAWKFCGIGFSGYWWGFKGYANKANQLTLIYNKGDISTYDDFLKKDGLSVRCLKYNSEFTQDGYPCTKVKYGSTVKDQDNNIYNTVLIGSQTWMVENLKTTKFNNGKAIPLVISEYGLADITTSGYCWYKNDPTNYKDTYGALYNWFAVNTDKLCPTGWHVPSDAEWTVLTDYLGGDSVSAGKLKETWFYHWPSPNNGATNETGFTALPGGYSNDLRGGEFEDLGNVGVWWSSSKNEDPYFVWSRSITDKTSKIYREDLSKENGFSVRCLKN